MVCGVVMFSLPIETKPLELTKMSRRNTLVFGTKHTANKTQYLQQSLEEWQTECQYQNEVFDQRLPFSLDLLGRGSHPCHIWSLNTQQLHD